MSAVPAREEKLLDSLQGLWNDARGALSDRVELFSVELGSAVRAGGQILMLVVAAAVVGVTAWLAAWGVVIGVLIALGAPWWGALLIVLVVNLGAAVFALARARKLLPKLSLPATRRHLTLAPSTTPPSPPPGPRPVTSAPTAVQPTVMPVQDERPRAVAP
jgi:Putative Actinobacterial Holin-X, holin superfamily III